jgi:hypothetical protein
MRYERFKVRRDTNTVHNVSVAPWEVQILELMYGEEGNVEALGEYEDVDREYPEANDEMFRLNKAYGTDPDTKVPHATIAFGTGRNGLKMLAKAIEQAQEEEIAAKRPRKRRAVAALDPLMA